MVRNNRCIGIWAQYSFLEVSFPTHIRMYIHTIQCIAHTGIFYPQRRCANIHPRTIKMSETNPCITPKKIHGSYVFFQCAKDIHLYSQRYINKHTTTYIQHERCYASKLFWFYKLFSKECRIDISSCLFSPDFIRHLSTSSFGMKIALDIKHQLSRSKRFNLLFGCFGFLACIIIVSPGSLLAVCCEYIFNHKPFIYIHIHNEDYSCTYRYRHYGICFRTSSWS